MARSAVGCFAVPFALIGLHLVQFAVNARTDYAVCASRLSVVAPAAREKAIRRFVVHEIAAGRAPASALRNCCTIDRGAGEFRLGHNEYVKSGAIRAFRGRDPSDPKPFGFFTNCGDVLSEGEYLDRYF